MVTMASNRSACMTNSTESAITSRDTREARMPSCPIEIPSETAMVVKVRPTPPLARTPRLASAASIGPVRLQGVTSLPAETSPTWGRAKSSSCSPTARSMARAPALAKPSVTSWEWILGGMARWYVARRTADARRRTADGGRRGPGIGLDVLAWHRSLPDNSATQERGPMVAATVLAWHRSPPDNSATQERGRGATPLPRAVTPSR